MTTTSSRRARRRLDVASLALLLLGLLSGVLSYWLITDHQANAMIIVPSIIAATIGATHITKKQAPRR